MDIRRHALNSALDGALSGVRDPYARRTITEAVIKALARRPKREPPEAGLAVPAVPPCGPLPLQGGAAAPLDVSN
ncbi:MAG: hypothetical protein ACTHKM_13075 [Tsuneonella sp.]